MEAKHRNPGAAGAATGASDDVRFSGERSEDNSTSPNFQESFARIHALGPRVVGEFIAELVGRDDALIADAGLLLDRYAYLTPSMVEMIESAP